MQVGDVVKVEHDGRTGRGRVEAIRGGRALVRLSIRSGEPWTSPLTGGTVPAGCPQLYVVWMPVDRLTPFG